MGSTPNDESKEQLPALAPERITIQVEIPPTEQEKLVVGGVNDSSEVPLERRTRCKLVVIPAPVPEKERMEGFENKHTIHMVMLLLNAIGLVLYVAVPPSFWGDLMTTAGFVDWPPFPNNIARVLSLVLAMITSVFSIMWIPYIPRTQPRLLTLYKVVTITTFILSAAPVLSFFVEPLCLPETTVGALIVQEQAVTTYNREYCQAWCRHDESGLPLLARGECSNTTTAFDAISSTVEVGDWCKQAIATKDFALVANHSGVCPFAGLKGQSIGKGGCGLGLALSPRFFSLVSGLVSLILWNV